jgi:hypothetical protein
MKDDTFNVAGRLSFRVRRYGTCIRICLGPSVFIDAAMADDDRAMSAT